MIKKMYLQLYFIRFCQGSRTFPLSIGAYTSIGMQRIPESNLHYSTEIMNEELLIPWKNWFKR